MPECARYFFRPNDIQIATEIFIPSKSTTIVYKFKVTNLGTDKRKLKISPQLIPYLNDAVIAPWDKNEWYLDTKCIKDEYMTVSSKLLNHGSQGFLGRALSVMGE